MKVRRRVAPEDSSVSSVLVPVRQVFQKVTTSSLAQHGEARIKYFLSSILPAIQRQKQTHTMIYIPSYFDFCSLRNVFLKRKTSFVSVTEYSRVTETSRARARFLQGRTPIMLYTGRAHFFLRHAIRGVKHLIFLGLPEHCEFYADQVNHLLLSTISSSSPSTPEEAFASAEATVASCLSVFTKYDAHALERIVGTSNCHRMVSSDKSTFMFQS
jgi:U3 small nucleolar RNA-associated protein 25